MKSSKSGHSLSGKVWSQQDSRPSKAMAPPPAASPQCLNILNAQSLHYCLTNPDTLNPPRPPHMQNASRSQPPQDCRFVLATSSLNQRMSSPTRLRTNACISQDTCLLISAEDPTWP